MFSIFNAQFKLMTIVLSYFQRKLEHRMTRSDR